MLAFIALPLFSLHSLTAAKYTCDANNALTPEQIASSASGPPGSDSSSGGRTDSCVSIYTNCPYCKSDPTGALCGDWYRSQLQDGFNGVVSGKRSLQSRAASLDCADDEVCMIDTGVFFCVDPSSLDFEDSNGGKGNLKSDLYTMSNGDVTSVASTATAIPTPTGSGTKASATGKGSGTAAGTAAGTATGTATGTGTAAGATSSTGASGSGNSAQGVSSSAENLKADSLFGLALVMVGAAGALL
jgi:hypothetical protein